jgi:hypothetical protein
MYVLCSRTARERMQAHVCERARVVKCSLIFGWILLKCTENILRFTKSWREHYIVALCFIDIHARRACTSARVSACVRARAWLSAPYLGTYSLNFWYKHNTGDHHLHGLHTFNVHAPRACMYAIARVLTTRACIRLLKFGQFLQIWREHTTDPQKLHGLFDSCINACANSSRQYTFAHRSHMITKRCQASVHLAS